MSFRKVLVGVDFSRGSVAALELAFRLVGPRGNVHALHVVEGARWFPRKCATPTSELARLVDGARPKHEPAAKVTLEVRTGSRVDEIVAAAATVGAEAIVLGRHEDAFLAARVPEGVARRGALPTIIVPPGDAAIGRVILALDFSVASQDAVPIGVKIADALGVLAEAVHVIEPACRHVASFQGDEGASGDARGKIEGIASLMQLALGRPVPEIPVTLRSGDPVEESGRHATERSIIVCGTHAFGRRDRLLFGSVATSLLRAVGSPLVVVPPALQPVAAG